MLIRNADRQDGILSELIVVLGFQANAEPCSVPSLLLCWVLGLSEATSPLISQYLWSIVGIVHGYRIRFRPTNPRVCICDSQLLGGGKVPSTFHFLALSSHLPGWKTNEEGCEEVVGGWGGIHPSLFLALGACVISTLGCRVPQSLCLLD